MTLNLAPQNNKHLLYLMSLSQLVSDSRSDVSDGVVNPSVRLLLHMAFSVAYLVLILLWPWCLCKAG